MMNSEFQKGLEQYLRGKLDEQVNIEIKKLVSDAQGIIEKSIRERALQTLESVDMSAHVFMETDETGFVIRVKWPRFKGGDR